MDDLARALRSEGLEASPWSNGPGDRYASHAHAYDKVLVVERGSIVFTTSAGPVELERGDRLELPAGTVHGAQVGDAGVTCLEAHLPAGRLSGLRRVPNGAW